MLQFIESTTNPFEQCNTDASNIIIDQPKSKYLKIFPNHITIPFDAAIILSIIISHPFDVPVTIHGRSMSWQQIENALWELLDALNTRVDACDAGTKSDARRPVDVHIQKSNNRHQIIDRDIRKTMIFMRILDIIKEMERTSMCNLSILGDGGVVVLHSNHPNYPTERSRTLNSYPEHTERLRQLPNNTNPSNDPTTSPNPEHLCRQSSNEYRPRSFKLTSATTTIILIISFLFLVHIQPVTGHYSGPIHVRVDAIGMMAISRIGRRHWRCCDDVEVHIGSDLSCFDKGLLVIVSRSIVSRSS